jgi:hypothetical protein
MRGEVVGLTISVVGGDLLAGDEPDGGSPGGKKIGSGD